jgi:two-component system, NtrC family, sensor histidine kinase GlrK
MLLGLAVIAVPLLVALGDAELQIRALADTGQQLVVDGVAAARASQELFAQISSLERTARLYQVLNDPKLLELYRSQDSRLSATRAELGRNARTDQERHTLAELGQLQQKIGRVVLAMPQPNYNLSQLLQSFADLSTLADRVADESNAQIDSQVVSLEQRTQEARRRLLWQSALLLPVTLIAILGLALAVGRPLRQLDRAISELGRGSFSNPIRVSGPVDLERLGRQLEWLRSRLVDLAQERNRFLRHMSHELKTPLANIREGTELLMDGAVGELDSNQREVTGILRENGIKLQRMIENLLSFSAWQTSSLGLDASEFRLRPVVKQVLENQQLTLLSQRVRLDVQVEDVTLIADRGKLRLILENLLSNAVKYSPKGGSIHLRARTDKDTLVIDVADSGTGIPPEDRPHIFDAFYTGRAAKGSTVKGTGIGLSVVTECVAAHGGTIEIVDGTYSGAHFRITMPTQPAGSALPANTGSKEQPAHAA